MEDNKTIIPFKNDIKNLKDFYFYKDEELIHSVTLNTLTKEGKCISSNTFTFFDIEDDEERKDLIVIRNKWHSTYISKEVLEDFKFTRCINEGHLIFTYTA